MRFEAHIFLTSQFWPTIVSPLLKNIKGLSFDTQFYEFMFNKWQEIQVKSFVRVKQFTKILHFFKTGCGV